MPPRVRQRTCPSHARGPARRLAPRHTWPGHAPVPRPLVHRPQALAPEPSVVSGSVDFRGTPSRFVHKQRLSTGSWWWAEIVGPAAWAGFRGPGAAVDLDAAAGIGAAPPK